MLSILLILTGTAAVNAASVSGNTAIVTNPLDASAQVYVSGYDLDPAVFYPGDSGTVTVHVTNAANTSLFLSHPNLIESHVHIINDNAFSTPTNIGPGETVDYNFVVISDGSDGTYFPLFTVSTNVYGGYAVHNQVMLKIDSTTVRASIASKPDTFALSTKDTVNVSVSNPRTGDITNLLIIPEVNGVEVSPEEAFVGTLKAGSSVQIPFAITPDREGSVTFHVSYRNGDNIHSTDAVLPVTLGENKLGAQIVVNGIESSGSGSTMTLKGDVTNNGLTDARSVLVTVGSPATPVNPNPSYAIGNLAPDDFSSFEVTYTQKVPGEFPIIVEYKDADGNTFTEKVTYKPSDGGIAGAAGSAVPNDAAGTSSGLSNRRGGMFTFGAGLSQVPVIPIVIILIVIIALIIAWRKGLLKRITDRFRKKPDDDDLQREH